LLSYPLAAVLKRIPDRSPWIKNIFIIGVSLFYLVGLFDLWGGLRTMFIDAAATYIIAYYIDGSLMPWIGFVFLMGHMSINHIRREMLDDPSTIDITGAQMVGLMKLSAFCWNVHDGRLPESALTDSQKSRALKEMPHLLKYTAWVMFFPSFMVGPAFDYADYDSYIDASMFATAAGQPAPPTKKSRKIPRSGQPATIKALTGLAWLGAYLYLSPYYNNDSVTSPDYMKYSLVRRIFMLYALGITTRTKYYAVWTLTEGACILSGLGYNGMDPKTNKPKWDRLENVNPLQIELAQNSRGYLEGWNKNTNHWLRNYVYLRVTPAGKKPGFLASLMTFGTSAFWHGFAPGYYLTFILAAFVQTVAKNFRRYIRPFFLNPPKDESDRNPTPLSSKRYYDFASWFVTQIGFSFVTAPFVLLTLHDSIMVWARVYFYVPVAVAVSIAFFSPQLPFKKMIVKKLEARNQRPHPLTRSHSHDTLNAPTLLGLPHDPAGSIDEAIADIRSEVEMRRRRGSVGAAMPTGEELKKMVESKIGGGFRIEQDKTTGRIRVSVGGDSATIAGDALKKEL
jgi:lysophospholipid acyltransferase